MPKTVFAKVPVFSSEKHKITVYEYKFTYYGDCIFNGITYTNKKLKKEHDTIDSPDYDIGDTIEIEINPEKPDKSLSAYEGLGSVVGFVFIVIGIGPLMGLMIYAKVSFGMKKSETVKHTPLKANTAKNNICTSCGRKNDVNSNFCTGCGKNLK